MSCSAKAESPLSTFVLVDFKSAAAKSNIEVPRSSVLKKVSSSAAAMDMMRPCSLSSSGYCGAIAVMLAAISSFIEGSFVPSKRMLRTTRRRMRRKTYPRPSLPGSTPSAIKNAQVRAWSATTRKATSDFGSAPYLRPLNSLARSKMIRVVSIS